MRGVKNLYKFVYIIILESYIFPTVSRETFNLNNHYMNNKILLDNLRCIPDFPEKGIAT